MLEPLLYLAFAVGHATIWVAVINYVYARPWNRPLLKACRVAIGALIVGLPVLVLAFDGLAVSDTIGRARVSGERWPLAAYEALCIAFGAVVLPAVTLRRQFRGRPETLLSESSEVFDVAAALGHKPVGTGRGSRPARLPFNDVFRIEFTTLELAPPGLPPALDGLTVLHLSDLHFQDSPAYEFHERVFDRIAGLGTPDVLAVTGDWVDTDEHHEWIGPLIGRLSWREAAFAILGNHDRWHDPEHVRRAIASAGPRVLGNGFEHVEIRGEPVVFVGNERLWFRPGPDLTDCPEGFRVCLSHTPDNVAWARRHGIGLMLSGHVHGGQIRVPGFGSIFVPSRYSRRYDQGTHQEGPTLLHVNRGLSGKTPLRFFCKPQVSWLVLRHRPSE